MVVRKEDKNESSNKNPEISVIIPMYNCEKSVHDVLDMFACQTFSDFEVICVIDGAKDATDRTEEFVKKYCEKDHRFSYIYKQNDGTGAALNAGMDIARGRYIVFSDAEDEYSSDYLIKLYETSVKHDAQITNCMFYNCDTLTSGKNTINGFERELFEEGVVYSHSEVGNLFEVIQPQVTNKMFNAEFLKENDIRFPETRIAEDLFFSYAGLSISERILFIRDCPLKYRININTDSIRSNNMRYIHEVPYVLRLFYKWLKKHSLFDVHGEDFMKRVDKALLFYGGQNVTPRFISDFAHMLNAEDPWDKMTSGEILEYFKESLFAEIAIKKESEINTIIKSEVSYKKREDYKYKLFKYRNMIHTSELLRRVSLERYGRDFSKTNSLPDNAGVFSSDTRKNGTKKDSKQLIVSFTSYPARVDSVTQVLDSLYAQSLKADKILLWLAEEQFPNKESDLPEALVADAQAGKFELCWCDDIGSHKKYFYTMQEFPDDIIVTVDDDMCYHQDTLKTLYESYIRYPAAVSALLTKLILFNDEGFPLPPNDWIYDFTQLTTPSMQLMAIGVGGVLYPPNCLDNRVFDKDTICRDLRIGGTYCSDDIWLKTHEVLAGVPTVLASQTISRRHIKDSQDTALWKKSPGISHTDTHFAAIHRHYSHDGKDELYEGLGACLQDPGYIPDGRELNFDFIIKDIELKVAAAEKDNWGDPAKDYLPQYFRRALSVINRQMSREEHAGAERECMNRLRNIALSVSGIDNMAQKDITLRALIEYGAVLRKSMWGAYRTSADYTQMQSNWEAFFKEHPDCDPVYKKGYAAFKKDMDS